MKSASWGGGTYENEYVKEGAIWKIKALHAYLRFCTPYADGWGKRTHYCDKIGRNLWQFLGGCGWRSLWIAFY